MTNDTNPFGQFDRDTFRENMFENLGRRRGLGQRMGHGSIVPNVLKALEEKPMYGYEVIQHFERKSHGFWRPSPGSVYPVLQSLEEQELVTSQEINGKRVYEITDAGRTRLKKFPGGHDMGGMQEKMRNGMRFAVLKEPLHRIMGDLRELGDATDEDLQEVKVLLDTLADQINAIAVRIPAKE
jgi:DNA-binding PadR family transcriptional regulator